MPSHLATPATALPPSDPDGRAGRGAPPALPRRRELRLAQDGERAGGSPPTVVRLPDAAELLAADDELDEADAAPQRTGRRRAGLSASPSSASPAPTRPAPRTPVPTTPSTDAPSSAARRAGRAAPPAPEPQSAGAPRSAASRHAAPVADPAGPRTRREARALAGPATLGAPWGLEPGLELPGGRSSTAVAERAPAMSMPVHFTAELELNGLLERLEAPVDPDSDEQVQVAEAAVEVEAPSPAASPATVVELPETPVVGFGETPVALAGSAHEQEPSSVMTRRARREIELLEHALALPAAGAGDDRERLLRAVTVAPLALPAGGAERAPSRHPGRSVFGLPQVGMVGVLGLAALVGPTVGQVAHAGTSATATVPASGAALAATPIGAVAEVPSTGPAGSPADVAPSADGQDGVPDAAELLAKREAAERASRAIGERAAADQAAAEEAAERETLVATLVPGCTGEVSSAAVTNGNGLLDSADLCDLWDGHHQLRPDAAVAMARLDLAFREAFGEDITISDAYRDYGSQVAVRAEKPALAARPGTSLHGWGIAVDLGGGIASGGERYRWLLEHAGEYGWENPAWARPGGGGPHEPWHWEFAAGRGGPSTTTDARP